jgi:tRNA modification GTPase
METIIGVSTVLGQGAINIIKISGPDSIQIVNKITKRSLLDQPHQTIKYNHILDFDNSAVDEVMISIFKAPNSYTKEDIVEINCHGGVLATKKIMDLLLKLDVRMSDPGEFTKRAFLNGRIDVEQVEAISGILNAQNEQMLKASVNQLSGEFKKQIEKLRAQIADIILVIEVNIDYPEFDGTEEITNRQIKKITVQIDNILNNLLKRAQKGNVVKNGVDVAIIGAPNAGKSSLLNALTNSQAAIVTNIPGTTRDVISKSLPLKNLSINLLDTAGIRQTDDPVEQIGIIRSTETIKKADLIIYVYDLSIGQDSQVDDLLSDIEIPVIKIANKIDLISKSDLQKMNNNNIYVSTKNLLNMDLIEEKIEELFLNEEIYTNQYAFFLSAELIGKLEQIIKINNQLVNMLETESLPTDLANYQLREIFDQLGIIIGEYYDDEIIDLLFNKFCLGK